MSESIIFTWYKVTGSDWNTMHTLSMQFFESKLLYYLHFVRHRLTSELCHCIVLIFDIFSVLVSEWSIVNVRMLFFKVECICWGILLMAATSLSQGRDCQFQYFVSNKVMHLRCRIKNDKCWIFSYGFAKVNVFSIIFV